MDFESERLAKNYLKGEPISDDIMKLIIQLYKGAKIESLFHDEYFDSAYHAPITSDLEFIIARFFYHFSEQTKSGWHIALRKQKNKTVPDLLVSKNSKAFAVIEIKAKGGWIQSFLSYERFEYDKKRLNEGKTQFDPQNLVNSINHQLEKYSNSFGIKPQNVFFLIPTLALVHRKRYKTELEGYYDNFAKNTKLPNENLILLSSHLTLNLSGADIPQSLQPTKDFEKMVDKIVNISSEF